MDSRTRRDFVVRRGVRRDKRNRSRQFRVRLNYVSLQHRESRLLNALDVQAFVLYTLFGQEVCACPDWITVMHRKRLSQVNLLVMNYGRADASDYPVWSFPTRAKFEALDSSVRSASGFMENFHYVPTLPVGSAGRAPLESEKLGPVARDALVLSWKDLIENGYPIPRRPAVPGAESFFKFTKDIYGLLSSDSPIFAVDCEFCVVEGGAQAVTRVSVVDELYSVVLDMLVKPPLPIVDYVTEYSGITADMLRNVTTTLRDVQRAFRKLLPCNAILVGHSLQFDLSVLHMFHPYVIDTSLLYNITGEEKRCSSLKHLSKVFLNSSIQTSLEGHCSVEDAVATMKLIHLKLQSGSQYGNMLSGWKPPEALLGQSAETRSSGDIPEFPSIDKQQESRSSSNGLTDMRTQGQVERCICNRRIVRPCRISDCSCRALVWRQRCNTCIAIKYIKESPSPAVTHADIYSIFEGQEKVSVLRSFERFEKTMQLVTCDEQSSAIETWESSASLIHRSVPNTEETLNTFRSDLFTYDLNMAIANLNAENVDCFDNFVAQLIKCLSSNSVLCLLILADSWSKLLLHIPRK